MREIVCAIYHDCNREARSMEMIECCRKLGHLHYVSYAAPKGIDDISYYGVDKNNKLALINFLNLTKKVIRKVKPEIVLLHDNDCSVLIPYIKKKFPQIKIVYDSSELYIPMLDDKKHKKDSTESWLLYIKQRLTSFRLTNEKKYLKDADVVIGANLERATIMKDYFGLNTLPIIFDNVHKIDDQYDLEKCNEKLSRFFDKDAFNILFAGGIGAERHTYEYITAFSKTTVKSNLIIAGSASAMAVKQYEKLVEDLGLKNVHYVGMLTRAELRYCMQNSQANVVIFDKNSYNTIYCASGKLYEGLFEGVPLLTSENPPLKRVCEEYGIGVSNDDYAKAISDLYDKHSECLDNVKKYISSIDYENRITVLKQDICERLGLE